ncbi:ankyrin repeat protein [Leptospira alstonii serovar Pingchang str. 80-412]|uniref:Ankyrin repeat protein n=3 Tax=Leptospira alstonii TaxID=28452 RepID=M6D6M6_9LEPT|nr:ankyrin repeat protein [Leptospira alstonii serovar Sichuan str. 79601]EQA79178.1 ankyrin repeat protein [Leptospira alstonii serovar Pingchang str. 80-412]
MIMGYSKNIFLKDADFQSYVNDPDFLTTLDQYSEIRDTVQKVVEEVDYPGFEKLLPLIPSFLSMKILTPKGSAEFLPLAAACHLCEKLNTSDAIRIMQKIVQRTHKTILGECLVYLASENHYLEPFRFLLECGADPNTQNREGYTALGRAKGNGCRLIVDYLNGNDENKNSLNPHLKIVGVGSRFTRFRTEGAIERLG